MSTQTLPSSKTETAPVANQIYIDGEFFDKENAKISVYDHGLLYGDGVFEGMRAYSGRVFKLKEHLVRLYDSAKSIHLTIPINPLQLENAVYSTLERNYHRDAYIRLLITRGVGNLGLDPYKCPKAGVIIITDQIALYSKEYYEKGLEIITAATVRCHPASLSPRVKSLNYLNNIMAKIEGLQAGCIEAMMLNQKGEVAECTGDNIFIVKKGVVLTPPLNAGILEGITRDTVIDLARESGLEVRETAIERHDVYVADEVFLTGSAAEVVPVVKVDSRPIGEGVPGPITADLMRRFREFVRK
jgi:branched-chain amino acid aminotransferase